MGCIASKPDYIVAADGDERNYQDRFLEAETLGQGEFGVVKLVHDVKNKDSATSRPLAVKYLRKGFQFKDNTLYSPIKKEVLQGEVEILRRLSGDCYCLKLVAVYESTSQIMMVTEYCEGGEMMPFVASAFDPSKGSEGLRTEDVSRISYQLLSAVDHCAKHRVIHRDIKPENVMFCTKAKNSELRLIDFGSGTLDNIEMKPVEDGGEVERHHTFAGSAFYISPEMFLRTYTSKTDVWSAGATLYVLVAGYPADKLQETFNILQTPKKPTDPQQPGGRLRKLPNLPDNLPDSFFEMLEGALNYGHKSRLSASELLKGEFPRFHLHHEDEFGRISFGYIAAEAAGQAEESVAVSRTGTLSKTKSVLLDGSVSRHTAYLGYRKFERSVTTLLATMLPKDTLGVLVKALKENGSTENYDQEEKKVPGNEVEINLSKLQIVTMTILLETIRGLNTEEATEVINMIESLKDFKTYKLFAYHVSLLRQFASPRSRRGVYCDENTEMDISIRSAGSYGARSTSVRGTNVWSKLKSRRNLPDTLNFSNHGFNNEISVKSSPGMTRSNTMMI
mmetsp:Transcript_27732/g.55982  ORF Transcript_27732/g.55982 Transcript_27732/m.55982 type:complete len:563 (-) Transcript_27732:155-1843(-)